MLKTYSRGLDMPPALRDSLVADESKAAAFNSLSGSEQDRICRSAAMGEDIDELMRLSDSAAVEEMLCAGLSEPDTGLL
ncbi:MAG: hypothetical protein IJ555_05510 [Ruminococcus sp.]|nr:hypothetical protein [Ruminococcus sp.]